MGKIIAIVVLSTSLILNPVKDIKNDSIHEDIIKNIETIKKQAPTILNRRINIYNMIKKYNPDLSSEEINQIIKSVNKYSKKYNLPEDLIYAIIAAESGFDPYIKGRHNDIGLMQILEAHAASWARGMKLKYEGPETLFNIDNNIHMGTYILAFLMKKYDNDLEKVLAGYNWGYGNVDRAVENGTDIPQYYIKLVKKHYYNLFQKELSIGIEKRYKNIY
ncbi:MAG: hypothetical protein PWQ82_821 [Thermosediminibacterales bacterium]|nr:hypothetical protein [Thermosediminibacterales bacterium]MDK2835760.1 hypothetical protein [Thermosediminibacterales bacterium]